LHPFAATIIASASLAGGFNLSGTATGRGAVDAHAVAKDNARTVMVRTFHAAIQDPPRLDAGMVR